MTENDGAVGSKPFSTSFSLRQPMGGHTQTTNVDISSKAQIQIYAAFCFAILMMGLTCYGIAAWYVPSTEFVFVATLPTIGLGLWFAYLVWRSGSLQNKTASTGLFLLLFIPTICWCGLVLGLPAAVTNFLGPNAEETVTVRKKLMADRVSRYNLKLVGYAKPISFVDSTLWDQISQGSKVRLTIRKDYFGTRIYDMKPL